MRKMAKENIIVACTVVVCVMLTLVLCFAFSVDGLIGVFAKTEIEKSVLWAIVSGGYGDISLARSSAQMIKSRGGAGYVKSGDEIEIVYNVYKSEDEAKDVISRLGISGVYMAKIEIEECDFKWCDKQYLQSVESALCYYDIAFECIKKCADELVDDSLEIVDAKTKIEVLHSQINDIKCEFYKNTANCDSAQITEIKLALITTLALLDNVEFEDSVALCASSLRYQLVQLVLCRQALATNI